MATANREFDFRGVNHIALVCKDMAKTVEFYRDILGMRLIKTLDLPRNRGQHFFFDIGNGDSLAFFWFPDAPAAAPGVAAPAYLPSKGSLVSGHGSMNHLALNIAADKFDEYYQRLVDKGIEVTPVLNHDDSPAQISADMHDGVFVRSVYFFDPDGVCLELASWTKEFTEQDVAHDPIQADGSKRVGLITEYSNIPAG